MMNCCIDLCGVSSCFCIIFNYFDRRGAKSQGLFFSSIRDSSTAFRNSSKSCSSFNMRAIAKFFSFCASLSLSEKESPTTAGPFGLCVHPYLYSPTPNNPRKDETIVIRHHVRAVVECETGENMKQSFLTPSVLYRLLNLHSSPLNFHILYALDIPVSRTIFT
jgi:hypothetical protein